MGAMTQQPTTSSFTAGTLLPVARDTSWLTEVDTVFLETSASGAKAVLQIQRSVVYKPESRTFKAETIRH